MDIEAFVRENFVRFLALVCLVIGLADASRLLGVHSGDANPILLLGGPGFVFLAVFTLARLFAAVGLWINASWGGALLICATVSEVALTVYPGSGYDLTPTYLLIRLGLLICISGLLGLRLYNFYTHVHD
jgi:hypothetical protein